jgi:hypothetical protein
MLPWLAAAFRRLLGCSKQILRLGSFDGRAVASDRNRAGDIDQRSTRKGAPVPRPPKLVLLTVLCVASASFLLAACGGSSPSLTSSAASEQQAEVKDADFARCLREHGVEATAVAGPEGKGHGLQIRGAGGRANMEAAQTACKKYQPEPVKLNLSPQEKVARAEAVEKFAKCMHEHGIEVHASSSEGRISVQIHGGPGSGGPNPESPAFQKAQQSCQGLLPFKGPHGGPPPLRGKGPAVKSLQAAGGSGSSSEDSTPATGG